MNIQNMSLGEIADALAGDGYQALADDRKAVYAIRRAARAGCLLWTRTHLVTTDSSRIEAFPR